MELGFTAEADRKGGSKFWANEVTLPVRDRAGHITGFAAAVRDITAWKAAEEERDRIFTLSADLICVAGYDGFFKRVNPSFTRLLGYSQAELLNRPYVYFVHPEDVSVTNDETASLAGNAGETPQSFQNRYRCADGRYCWLEWKSISYPADQLIYAVARDVTQNKEVEQKLKDYSAELERSNIELQQFAYVASHDLQEPLRAVAGCVQMLEERNAGKLDERSLILTRHAVDGAKRMQALINDLLAFSRVGSKGISRTIIDPRQAVDRAIGQLQVAIVESGALIFIEPLPPIFADIAQLAQLFQNLIGNAIKFRSGPGPQITVSAEKTESGTMFSVSDNGIGIESQYHDRVFGLFQRLNSRNNYAGTGIGLAICKKIVERHGGRIWIESEVGKGASFRFTIPIEIIK